MADNETIADIIAEMRDEGHTGESSRLEWVRTKMRYYADRLEAAYKREIDEIKKQVADLQQQLPKPDPNWRDICAKCFENGATEPPDCKYYTEDGCMSPIPDQHPLIQVGNAAKLREALVEALDLIFDMQNADRSPLSNQAYAVRRKIKAALAEPPRNCDVGTAEEQANRWYWRYHVGHLCQSCPLGPRKWSEIGAGWFCFSEWLQMPYEEGGAE